MVHGNVPVFEPIAIMNQKKLALALALPVAASLLLATGVTAQAAEGPWLVRARAVHLESANGGGVGVSINNKWLPEVDISYFFAPNIAAELVLTVPQKQDVFLGGTKVGTLRHLPPTLTAQYHFIPGGTIRPYVGAGLNYTRFSSVDLPAPFSIEKNSFGPAVQAGVDFAVAPNVVLNIDVKKVYIRTDVSAAGTKLGTFKVDPLLVGVGVGYRF
jgi:outer membrane protein